MKKIYFILATASLLFSGCNKLLDELPDNQVEIQTAEDVRKLLVNAYSINNNAVLNEYSSDNIGDYGPSVYTWGLISGQLAYWQPVQEYFDNDGLYYNWQSYYNAINHANKALEAIQELGGGSEFNAAKGEALLARAYAHFELANTFCLAYNPTTSSTDLGIPYMLHTEKELSPKYPRGTVAQVYDLIDKDIQAGLPLIDDNYYETPKYHFNKRAANAFAARFYLYYQQWQKALNYANEVLTTNNATTLNLLRNWEDFRDTSKAGTVTQGSRALYYTNENIDANLLVLPVYSQIARKFYSRSYRYNHNTLIAGQETVEAPNVWDPEGKSGDYGYGYAFYWFEPIRDRNANTNIVLFDKFPTLREGTSYNKSIMVPFTTDETLLVRAEAKIHLKQYASAVEDLNMWTSKFIQQTTITVNGQTYSSRNTATQQQIIDFYKDANMRYSTADAPTQKKTLHPSFTIENDGIQENLLHYLLQCRRVLTLGDGLRWQDVKRYGIEVVRYRCDLSDRDRNYPAATLPVNDPRRAIQLPDVAIRSGMQPNPR